MPPPVSIAVVSWNTRDLLARCLASMHPEVEAGRAEVWVVDNASADGSPDLVRTRFPWATLEASPRNLGFGAAVNLVAGRSASPWVAPSNADVELQPGALEALLEAGARDRGAGAIAPRLVLPDGTTQHSVFPFPTLTFAALFNLGVYRVVPGLGDRLAVPGAWDPERPRRVPWAAGAFMIVRREAWEAAGGFDEAQWMYTEDLDLGWRLAKAGWATRYEPRSEVRHHASAATTAAWGEGQTERWLLSTYAWMLRRRGPLRMRAFALLNLAGAVARWAALSIPARLRPGAFARRRDQRRTWAARHRRTGLARRERLQRHR
jgi:N-acetylglucosaminyl-diphospho-decaprenol L-rhamnosyltransferase